MNLFAIAMIALLLFGCKQTEKSAGIWLSFDDRSIDEWYTLRNLMKTNKVFVTFFVTQPDSLTADEVDKLKKLQLDGHEIGFHGNMHVLSEHYIKENGYRRYLKDEIDSGLKTMNALGFSCTSFAYPYGAKFWFTDLILSSKFDYLRGVVPLNKEKDLTTIDEIFYSFNKVKSLYAISFDSNSGISNKMLKEGISRAKEKNEVLMLYAHSPTKSDQKNYSFSTETLKFIIDQATANNLTFYTTKTLASG